MEENILRLVVAGHVDHGKSTLIGKLLYETGSLPADKIKELAKISNRTEFAYLLDYLQEERKQKITIETTQVFFKSHRRSYVIIDTPGHVEFIKNMITGASQADAAVLVIDVKEGLKEQTKRHCYILSLLGLNQIIVALNKMELVNFSYARFRNVKKSTQWWLKSLKIRPLTYVPISATGGENVTKKSEAMKWYTGPTFLQSLDSIKNKKPLADKPLIFSVQDVHKVHEKLVSVGRIESGVITKGDEVKILPGNFTAKIHSLNKFPKETEKALAGECIGITTTEPIHLERGYIVCKSGCEPVFTDKIDAKIFWMSPQKLDKEQELTIICATQKTLCKIKKIHKRIDTSMFEIIENNAQQLKNLELAQVTIVTQNPIAIKDLNDVPGLGRFVLLQNNTICAGGIITIKD